MAEKKEIKVTRETRELIINLITMIYDMIDDNRLVSGLKSLDEMKRNARGLYSVLDAGKYDKDTQRILNSWRKYYIKYTQANGSSKD